MLHQVTSPVGEVKVGRFRHGAKALGRPFLSRTLALQCTGDVFKIRDEIICRWFK